MALNREDLNKLSKEELIDLVIELGERSITDYTTSLLNKGSIDDVFLSLEGHAVSAIMCDIDNFKAINDFYGHNAGDIVLGIVGSVIKAATRRGDYSIRYGGDEFLIMLESCDEENAKAKCELISRLVKEKCGNNPRIGVEISMSFGIAYSEEIKREVIDKADQALYQSKNEGKDRITVYEEPRIVK
jgi:diguanylate cyclase (GGDEF)-like protein